MVCWVYVLYTSLFAMKGSSRNKTGKSLTNYSMRTVTVRIFTHSHILTVYHNPLFSKYFSYYILMTETQVDRVQFRRF